MSTVEKWTGDKVKEMEKVLLPILARHQKLPDNLVRFVRTLLDFSYIARAARMTNSKLEELGSTYTDMHCLKQMLVSSGIYKGLSRLDGIRKWHMCSHYVDSICELGTPDGYNTRLPKYLHIIYVKHRWAVSNKLDVIPQLIDYCWCLEALGIHTAYLNDYYGEQEQQQQRELQTTAVFVKDDEDGEYNPGDLMMKEAGRGKEGDGEEESVDNVDDGIDNNEEGERRRNAMSLDAIGLKHPAPEFAIVVWPTRTATLQKPVGNYSATSFEQVLRLFLQPSQAELNLLVSTRKRLRFLRTLREPLEHLSRAGSILKVNWERSQMLVK